MLLAALPAISATFGPGVDETDGSEVVIAVAVAGVPLVVPDPAVLVPVFFNPADVEGPLIAAVSDTPAAATGKV